MSDTFYMKRGDTSPGLVKTLLNPDGTAVDLTGAAINIHVFDRNGNSVIDASATIDDAAAGIVSYIFGAIAAANYNYEFEVTYSDSSIETFPNSGFDLLVVERDLA